ncbi:N-acetylmuramoyl-L-alanine amidase CwlD [Pradoshia eiseniae]|uniref:N-acetylmuramoyl-L-alanine amidase CwlD n=1 Tax=Pradoshia eiseniae TaxID=2064768 RepID=A0A2S7MWR9_9BACI|nr:N-acetylmuramoyl-L-alanine amidase CwlD [Pradoshia eiseniae]PQD94206.1 N-acetylmuramoyl-L-alanine amidase CwlD [Pradoshia eiseniae]
MNLRKKLIVTGFLLGVACLFLLMTFKMNQNASFQAWNLPLSGKIIIIDPGHGGIDGGAAFKGVIEKNVTLPISVKLRDYLQEQGALVLMTREDDADLADERAGTVRERKRTDLVNRTKFINESQADMFISVHANAFPQSNSKGAQTFYSPAFKENKRAAKLIQAELIRNLKNTTRKAKPLENVYLVKYAKKPGVLVEVGFLSNDQERMNLQNEVYQDDVALSIYTGVIRYFLKEDVAD